jgi:hypothetical protein
MSYFNPGFANLTSGWFRITDDDNYAIDRKKIDSFWDSHCDQILIKYIKKYGSFYTAFCSDIKSDIEDQKGVTLKEIRYYEYYFQTRAFELPGIKEYLTNSYAKIKDRTIKCGICAIEAKLDEIHPNVIRHQYPPSFCTECFYLTRPYHAEWNGDIKNRVIEFLNSLDSVRRCNICKRKYKLKKIDISVQQLYMPIVHVNIYSSICPNCLMKIIYNDIPDLESTQLKRLFNLYEFLGKIPTQDYYSFYFLFKELSKINKLTELLHSLWSPEVYKKHFGSFFAALVKSGILPEGTKKMKIGTMVLAKDGHVCLSLAEKNIDDFLCLLNINHKKEVYYPHSDYRTDWEVVWNKKIYFIEYFGLMNNREYAKRARQKALLASSNNIELISIYPETDWKKLIVKLFK